MNDCRIRRCEQFGGETCPASLYRLLQLCTTFFFSPPSAFSLRLTLVKSLLSPFFCSSRSATFKGPIGKNIFRFIKKRNTSRKIQFNKKLCRDAAHLLDILLLFWPEDRSKALKIQVLLKRPHSIAPRSHLEDKRRP